MPIELQIIRASDFVRLDAYEHLNFQASKEALAVLARACRKRGLDRAMLDLRALPIPPKPLFTVSELASLVETFREAGFGRHQRLAVLYRSDPHRGARRFAFISRMRGWQVRAFGEFEEAFLWLEEWPTSQPERRGKKVPIEFASRQANPKKSVGRSTAERIPIQSRP
jgi:hypothetical protein